MKLEKATEKKNIYIYIGHNADRKNWLFLNEKIVLFWAVSFYWFLENV